MASVKVAVRVRPLNQREVDMNSQVVIQMSGKKTSIQNTKIHDAPSGQGDSGRERMKDFTFDHSYWTMDPSEQVYHSQQQVFEDLGVDVIKSGFEGYNACIFAYGQTGSGKTYTMMGKQDDQGLIPRICQGLFLKMNENYEDSTTYRTEVSYLEIYNEHVRDLLRNKNDQSLRVREHPKEGPYVQDLSKHLVVSYSDIKELMDRGNSQRTTASTNMNDTSSRSHAIFTIKFVQAKFNKNMPSETQSKIHLVDLAGSERADATGATGQRLKEGASINKSLVTLGNVISTLAEMSDRKSGKIFIPYRDSVLTWLLKDSLGGNSKTIMIATISPADVNYGETLSTLRYANRAKNIINKPTVNEDPNVRLIRELREEISRLKAMLGGNLDNITSPRVKERLHENEARVKVLTDEWAGKWKEIQHILEDQTLALRKVQGLGVVLDSDLPHLIGLDDDILSTGIMLFHLKEGKIRIGRADSAVKQDIVLNGLEVESEHCLIDHHNGVVTLQPIEGAFCSVNGVHVAEPIVLSQGAVILLGQTNMFRFNHPAQAAKLREEHTKGNLQSRSLLQKTSLSQSMSSLVQSTENLASFSPVFELEERHRKEMEQLDEKRRLIEEMEQRFQLSEDARIQEQTQKEREMEKRREEMRLMQQEMERLKVENEKAKLHIKTEEDRLRRKSLDLVKQKQFFETQRDIQLAHLQEQKEKELEAFEKERLNLQNEKEELGRTIEEEVQKLRVEEERQQRAVEEAKSELALELEALLQEQEQQKLLNEREQKRLEEQERVQVEELKKMESDIKVKRDSLKKEQQQEMEKLAVERNNLLLLKEQQANAMKLLEDFESTAKESLQAEREKLADTLIRLDSREAGINERYEKLECEIITKHEDSWNELCDLRKKLDDEKKELEALVEKLNSMSSSDEEYSELSAAVETGRLDVAKREKELCDKEKDLEVELQNELSDLQAEKQKELESLEEEKARIKNSEESTDTQTNHTDIEALKREISEREGHISQATKQLDQLEQSYQESLTKATQEKSELGLKREELAEKVKQQEETTKLAYESLQRKQTVLEKEAEVESTKIEEQRQRVTQLEQMQQELCTSESGIDTGTGAGDDWSGFEERVKALRQLEDQYQRSERELEEKQRKFESERQQELDRIEMEKYKLQELENQERINALVEQEVKRRLFEEKVQREKQRRMEREQERQEREMEMEKMKRAHDKEIKRLKQRYNDLTASVPAPVKTRANPYASIQNTDAEFVVDQERKLSRSLSNCRCDDIHVCIPSYTLRGHGSDFHHEFEVKVIIGHECWAVYRRYKRFRELHSFMKSRYPELGKLAFPARKLFGRHSEKFVSERKAQLEHYLQSFIEILQNDPNSLLHRSQNKGLSKQLLCEFLPFFKKGVFETSKHNTS